MIQAAAYPELRASIVIPCRRGEYAALRDATAWLNARCDALRASRDARERLDFCLNEVLANIIDHGLDDEHEHRVTVSLDVAAQGYTLTLRDDGRPFDVARSDTYTTPQSLQEAGSRGYGLHLVHSLATRVEYQRDGSWNVVAVFVGP
ncbi:MAG: ATP-binding protein [Ignavibacteriae bacterium]|nr:ATP-binding protein [Ignavibacteriota bacterium]